MSSINYKVKSATKWSAITEIAAKLVSPITTMVLARLLTPESFGVLVTATMVISFAEIFTDAGFQKYIVQHEFYDKDSLYNSTEVAFWTNLVFSLFVWIVICLFSPYIAHLVGNDGYGLVIAVSCICIPIEGFSSIQMALFKRDLDFKTLFQVRIVGILIPLIVTIPLAIWTHSYWSLIVGMIALNISNALLLTLKSKWKPKFYYSFKLFIEMFSFTMWSMLEAISIWLTGYLDVFIVGTILSTYYMGVYRTAINMVGGIMAIITSVTTPVLFSALSRLQSDPQQFKVLFFRFQKLVGILVIPLGVGILLFRDFITEILLGNQWKDASFLIGWWGLTSSLTIVLSHYSSEVYRSLGKPKLSFLSQILHLCCLIPVVLITARMGFDTLCISRSLVRFTGVIINFVILFRLIRITPQSMIINILPSIIASLIMTITYILLPVSKNMYVDVIYIVLCAMTYFAALALFKQEKYILKNIKSIIKI